MSALESVTENVNSVLDAHRISVVIPCYNGARFLPETLESVLRQTRPAHEILVIDDGSTDESAAIAASFGPLVRVIRQTNQGESVARNRGIDEARGDWVAFVDADDLWDPAKLERQSSFLNPGMSALCSGHRILDSATGQVEEIALPDPERFKMERILADGAPCHISTLIVRADVPIRFPVWTKYAEDSLYLLELARWGRIEIVPHRLSSYRRHPQSQMRCHDIELKWHNSFDRWIVEHSNIEDPQLRDHLRAVAIGHIAYLVELSYWNRDWERFDLLSQYLSSRQELPGIATSLPVRRFPRWCYRVKDCVETLVRRQSRDRRVHA